MQSSEEGMSSVSDLRGWRTDVREGSGEGWLGEGCREPLEFQPRADTTCGLLGALQQSLAAGRRATGDADGNSPTSC